MSGERPRVKLHVDDLEPIESRPGWAAAERRVRSRLAKLTRIDIRVKDRMSNSGTLQIDHRRLVTYCTDLELDLAAQDDTPLGLKTTFAANVVAKTLDGAMPDFSGFS